MRRCISSHAASTKSATNSRRNTTGALGCAFGVKLNVCVKNLLNVLKHCRVIQITIDKSSLISATVVRNFKLEHDDLKEHKDKIASAPRLAVNLDIAK